MAVVVQMRCRVALDSYSCWVGLHVLLSYDGGINLITPYGQMAVNLNVNLLADDW